MKSILYIIVCTFITATSCSSTNQAVNVSESQNILPQTVEKNIAYGDNPQQIYDLYLPKGRNETTTKTLVIIHGGSWIGGSKEGINFMFEGLQKYLPEYAVVNMNYRLANGSDIKAFPNQLEDIQSLLNHLKSKKKDLEINGDVTLVGLSSGAHIAALYAIKINQDSQVKAVVNIVGPTDFTDPYYRDNSNFQVFLDKLIDKNNYENGSDVPMALSPAQQVNTYTPPMINFYGNTDQLVALSQLERLEDGLKANNIPYESTIYDGGHANWNAEQYKDLLTKTKAFLEQHF